MAERRYAGRKISRFEDSFGQARYVSDGSTVRVLHPEENPEYQRRLRRRKALEAAAVREEKRRQEMKAMSMNAGILLLAVIALVVTVYFGYSYIHLKNSVNEHMEAVKQLEKQLETRRTENDALEQSIDTSIDLSYVYNVATNELGMVRSGQDNVIRYDKTESEYVRQYENIPDRNL